MAAWIHLIFYSMITYNLGMVHVFLEFIEVENWRFHGRFSCVLLSFFKLKIYIEARISEMATWIHLIFYSMMSYIRGMLVIFIHIVKNENWRFYGNFSYFWVNIDFVHLDSELRYGWMDSSDILQHDDLYLWDETCLHGKWNWILYSCFSTFQLNIDLVHLNAGLLHGVFYYLRYTDTRGLVLRGPLIKLSF